MKKDKQILFSALGVALVIMAIVGVAYSFFNYTKTGTGNTIRVGRMSFVSRQTDTINLTNVFPIASSMIDTDTDNIGLLEIEIAGDTDYANGLEYLITTVNSNISCNGKKIPISLDIEVEDLGEENIDYFIARESKTATIYKKLSGNGVIGDQQLLVGYIKPNTTSGTIEGINGKITIKAYLDKDRIAISDTYDGLESDLMATTREWLDDRLVLTTTEWNSLRETGISFQIKVEANEGIWVNEPFYNKLLLNSVMDNIESTNVLSNTGIDFSKISGDTDNDGVIDNGQGLYLRSTTENDAYPVIYYRGNVTNNNVYFANKCWQMIRTTDTGGIKMIYNGENTGSASEPNCENTEETSRQISLNIEGIDTNTFPFSELDDYGSPSYIGYMFADNYEKESGAYQEGAYFGRSFSYDSINNVYTLVDTQIGIDENHHYTCNLTDETGTCSSIRYYFSYVMIYNIRENYLYFTLTDGDGVEDIILKIGENVTDSYAKNIIDKWYEDNLDNTIYTDKIEDTVYCNDRSIVDLGGMNPNGGRLDLRGSLHYMGYRRLNNTPSMKCLKVNDSFTKENVNGNGLLEYSVGLITVDEIALAGGIFNNNNEKYYLNVGNNYWTMSPYDFSSLGNASMFFVDNNGAIKTYTSAFDECGFRPLISLKYGVSFKGDGTEENPYIVEYD